MPPKRKNDQTELSFRERKKLKLADARTISVQSTSAGSGEGGVVAGPSSTDVRFDSMKGLPAAIDVERFVEARAFEIEAMQTAIQNAGSGSTQRAWQALPRHLRRRAASHDVRRVPWRLREKARAEMDSTKKKAQGHSKPKQGKANRISRTESFLRRQRDKSWLETHVWHAKRMHMDNMWGYRLAVSPTEKSFRPSHRASVHGSILHDASYYGLIEIQGPEYIIKTLLENCYDPHDPGIKRFLSGARVLETHLYKHGEYPYDLIAPISVMFRPVAQGTRDASNNSADSSEPANDAPSANSNKGKGKEKEPNNGPCPSSIAQQNDKRTVWIRCHPGAFDDVFAALQASASLALAAAKQSGQTSSASVEMADLRGSVNVFEIMGPKSSQVIKGALTPIGDDKREELKKFWSSLNDLQTSGSVPRGMIIGLTVHDPRLKFPPKNAKPRISQSGSTSSLFLFPTSTLAQSDIWEEEERRRLSKPRYKKKDLDERRSKNLVPGTALTPLRKDDRIPILLIQRSTGDTPESRQGIHGWTIIIPAGWSMAFFSSLTYTGTRVAGQRERQTQGFEAQCAYFPRDFMFTPLYEKYSSAKAQEDKEKWERKPPAKRPNYDKLGIKDPWRPDWKTVLGIKDSESSDVEELVPTQRESLPSSKRLDHGNSNRVRPWLLRGPAVSTMLKTASEMLNSQAALLAEVSRLRARRAMEIPSQVTAEDLWKGALVLVGMKTLKKGSPSDLALVYGMTDEEVKKCLKRKQTGGTIEDEDEVPTTASPGDAVIGYVTTGNFSLSQGTNFAIGALPFAEFFALYQQTVRLGFRQMPLVKIRDRDAIVCRVAQIELLSE